MSLLLPPIVWTVVWQATAMAQVAAAMSVQTNLAFVRDGTAETRDMPQVCDKLERSAVTSGGRTVFET